MSIYLDDLRNIGGTVGVEPICTHPETYTHICSNQSFTTYLLLRPIIIQAEVPKTLFANELVYANKKCLFFLAIKLVASKT
jgi:hypothetical protein